MVVDSANIAVLVLALGLWNELYYISGYHLAFFVTVVFDTRLVLEFKLQAIFYIISLNKEKNTFSSGKIKALVA